MIDRKKGCSVFCSTTRSPISKNIGAVAGKILEHVNLVPIYALAQIVFREASLY